MNIRPGRLNSAARQVLASTLDAALEADIEAGRSEVWEIEGGESYAVTRYESDRPEFVICAYAGSRLREFFAHVHELCAARGVPSIRWHTLRPATARLLSVYRPEVEYVYRVRVCIPADKQVAA